jgi:hypothetical protein
LREKNMYCKIKKQKMPRARSRSRSPSPARRRGGRKAVVRKRVGGNKWSVYLARFRQSHPGISLRDAMIRAKSPYRRLQAAGKI